MNLFSLNGARRATTINAINKIMDTRLHSFVILVSLNLVVFTVFFRQEYLFIIFIVLAFIFSIINTAVGLSFIIYGLPIAPTLENPLFTPVLTISFVTGAIIRGIFVAGQKPSRTSMNLYDFHLLILLFIVSVSTAYYNPYNIGRYSYFVSLLFLSIILIRSIKSDERNLLLIINSIILSGLFIAILSLILSDSNTTRLAAANMDPSGGIRILANSVSCSTIFLYLFYFHDINRTKCFLMKNGKTGSLSTQVSFILRSRFLLLAFFILTLVMTSSRGSIIAVATCIILAPTMDIFGYLKSRKNNSKTFLFVITTIFIGSVFFVIYKLNVIDVEYFFSRFQSEGLESGSSIRTEIWLSGIRQMEGIQLLIGYGLGSFRDLAIVGGYDFYAHSFLIDTLASAGAFGIIVIFSLTAYLLLLSIREKNSTAILIILFCNLLFLTHGSLYSFFFWLLYALSYSIIKVNRAT